MINESTVLKLAAQLRIQLTKEEVEKIAKDLAQIVEYFEQLNRLEELKNYEPSYTPTTKVNALREAEPRSGLSQSDALRNAISEKGFIKAPRI